MYVFFIDVCVPTVCVFHACSTQPVTTHLFAFFLFLLPCLSVAYDRESLLVAASLFIATHQHHRRHLLPHRHGLQISLQAFGIDDNRLILAALAPSFLIFPLYLRWSSQQERDDFFDGYEKRRQG